MNPVCWQQIGGAYQLLKSCTGSPGRCRINRLNDKPGFCQTGLLPVISSTGLHFGEESALAGSHGSGTIFLAHCNFSFEYCQNYDISQCGTGKTIAFETSGGDDDFPVTTGLPYYQHGHAVPRCSADS
jgi:putative pyruvate formate lyase activating enzyme